MAVGSQSQWLRAPVAKAGDPGSIPGGCLGFVLSSWLSNVDEVENQAIPVYVTQKHNPGNEGLQ